MPKLGIIAEAAAPRIASNANGSLVFGSEEGGTFSLGIYQGVTEGGGSRLVLSSELGECGVQLGYLQCSSTTFPETTLFEYVSPLSCVYLGRFRVVYPRAPLVVSQETWLIPIIQTDDDFLYVYTLAMADPPTKWSGLRRNGLVYPPSASPPRHAVQFNIKVNGLPASD